MAKRRQPIACDIGFLIRGGDYRRHQDRGARLYNIVGAQVVRFALTTKRRKFSIDDVPLKRIRSADPARVRRLTREWLNEMAAPRGSQNAHGPYTMAMKCPQVLTAVTKKWTGD